MEILRDAPFETGAIPEQEPLESRLRYGSSFHQQIVGRIRARLKLAERHISNRYDDWDRANEHVQLYIDLSRYARRGDKSSITTKREMPFERSIVVPMAYSVLQVRLTALMALFTAREPIIQVEGRAPEDVMPAKMMEALLAYDMEQMQAPLVLYGFLKNAEVCGLGVIADSFEREQGWTQQRVTDPMQQMLAQLMGMPMQQQVWGTTREYCRAEVIDPYEFRPDPRVPGAHVQEMEFVGHRTRMAHTLLLGLSQEHGGPYLNVPFLRQAMHQRREQLGRSRTTDLPGYLDTRDVADERDRGVYLLEYLQVRLVPRDWGLGSESRPEIWQFVLAEDAVVLQAERRSNLHGQFGYSVAQTHYDPHVVFSPGMIEQMDGLQRMGTWMYNSHTENIKKIINDALVYGPSWIEENDLLNPGPAKHIRLSRKGEELVEGGRMTPQQMVAQLVVGDVTQGHLRELQTLFDMIQRMTGINDPAMGQPTDSKRTLGEIERILVSSSRRMATQAQLYDAQAIQPLARRLLSDRQQYTSQDQYIRITGRLAQELKQERLFLTKDSIQGNFDYIPMSGTLPPDPERFAQTWIELLGIVGKVPPLTQPGPDGRVLDPRWFLKRIAEGMGIKTIEDAFIQVMPPPQMQAALQAGNIVPMGAVPPGGGPIPGAGIQTPMVPGGLN